MSTWRYTITNDFYRFYQKKCPFCSGFYHS
jgi:hypothetical protein